MQDKVQDRDKGNERVEAKSSIRGEDFPRVDESRIRCRAGEEGDMLSSALSEILY